MDVGKTKRMRATTEVEDRDSVKPYENKKRQKKSVVWQYLEDVEINGKKHAKCVFCGKEMICNVSKSTTSFKRHLDKCLAKHGQSKQALLQFQQGGNDDQVTISQFKYDHALVREKVAHYILINELPFLHVESYMFNEVMKTVSPYWKKITRATVKLDCQTTYETEKISLKRKLILASKINITTDMWTSNQKIGYMVVTGHWIDKEWKLNSRVLNFCNVPPPHSGHVISESLFKCLVNWGIEDKIGTITVDNAKANDVALRHLKESFSIRKSLPVGGKLFHVRCSAHILNLCVQDGLKPIESIIDRIRDGVKYVAGSEGRRLKFAEICKQLDLKPKKLILDVPTRWNSTFNMLNCALGFKQVFHRYAHSDGAFAEYVPLTEDWEKVEVVCKLLEVFNNSTKILSGSEYPTSNLFLSELKRVKQAIDESICDPNTYISQMAMSMKDKFDKYWKESNLMLSIGAVMDPRFNLALIRFCFHTLYPLESESEDRVNQLRSVLNDLYQYYVAEDSRAKGIEMQGSSQMSSSDKGKEIYEAETLAGVSEFELYMMSSGASIQPVKSELDDYLSEQPLMLVTEALQKNYDALGWWKANSPKYPILSQMARDVLAVPVSTVASESTFSAGGRVIDPHRSCLKPETVEMLMCGADWARQLYGLKKTSQEKVTEVEIDLS